MARTKDPSYRLHKSTGKAIVTLSGKDYYLGEYGTPESQALYAVRLQQWKAAGKVADFDTGTKTVKQAGSTQPKPVKQIGIPKTKPVKQASKQSKGERRDPAYRLHRASGNALVTLSGRDIYLGRHGTPESHALYAEVIEQWKAAGKSASFDKVVGTGSTLAEIAEKFMDWSLATNGNNTEHRHNCRSIRPVLNLFPLKVADDFTIEDFEKCVTWWLHGGKWLEDAEVAALKAGTLPSEEKTLISKQYVTKMLKYLRTFFRWARKRKLFPADVLFDINESKTDTQKAIRNCKAVTMAPKVEAYDDKRIELICGALPPIVADMVRLQRFTAARPDELCRIKPAMVDRSASTWVIHYDEHKNAWRGHDRAVHVGPKGQKILAKYLDNRDPDEYCFSPAEVVRWKIEQRRANRKTPLSCGNKAGTNRKESPKTKPRDRYDHCTFGKAIKRVCAKLFPIPEHLGADDKKLELKRWKKANWLSPNQLRHTRATEIESKHGMASATASLDHKDQKTTRIYVKPRNELAAKAAKKSG